MVVTIQTSRTANPSRVFGTDGFPRHFWLRFGLTHSASTLKCTTNLPCFNLQAGFAPWAPGPHPVLDSRRSELVLQLRGGSLPLSRLESDLRVIVSEAGRSQLPGAFLYWETLAEGVTALRAASTSAAGIQDFVLEYLGEAPTLSLAVQARLRTTIALDRRLGRSTASVPATATTGQTNNSTQPRRGGGGGGKAPRNRRAPPPARNNGQTCGHCGKLNHVANECRSRCATGCADCANRGGNNRR